MQSEYVESGCNRLIDILNAGVCKFQVSLQFSVNNDRKLDFKTCIKQYQDWEADREETDYNSE